MKYIDRIMGCLYGGAVGDALGYPVEFLGTEEITKIYGRDGIRDYACQEGKALISDDTQMTLFTLGGLLAWRGDREKDKASWKEYVWKSYQDWLFTQDPHACPDPPRVSWLADEPVMHAGRAPGLTCLSALENGICGSIGRPVNDSKGCGGLMRVAPAAFWFEWDYTCRASLAGAKMAAMTHGHPMSTICAAAFVEMLEDLLAGSSLKKAVEAVLDCPDLLLWDGKGGSYDKMNGKGLAEREEFKRIMEKAVSLSGSSLTDREAIEAIGEGWVAEETLAIAVYCALKHEGDFAAAVTAAVNHGGDSDSTGAVTGNLMGAACGYSRLPGRWLERLEAKEILDRLALELAHEKKRESIWGRVRNGRWFGGYLTKNAMRMDRAFVIEEPDYGRKDCLFEYLLLYQRDEDRNGVCCKVRLGPRRFIQLSDVVEGSLEIALYIKKKGEEPCYRWETLPYEKKETPFRFDAERYLKDHGIHCHPAKKEDYNAYAFEFRNYTNSQENQVSRAYASRGGLFYWTYAWLDCSVDEVRFLYADPQPDEQGEKYYGGRRTWGGLAEEQLFDDELQREAELDILERIGIGDIMGGALQGTSKA